MKSGVKSTKGYELIVKKKRTNTADLAKILIYILYPENKLAYCHYIIISGKIL